MKTLRITYRNGRTLDMRVKDYDIYEGRLWYRSDDNNAAFIMHMPWCSLSTAQMEKVEEV